MTQVVQSGMYYPLVAVASVLLGLYVVWYILKLFRRESISQLPGPPSESWLVGHLPAFERPENAGDADFEWADKYGLALRTKGCFGEDFLHLADPKALQYVLNKSGYKFPKTPESRVRAQITTGHGILWAEGAQHSRQRKIMNPAFSHSALKGFLPLFLDVARKTSTNWKIKILQEHRDSSVVDVSSWLARTTLDAIGQAAFGYRFNSIDNEETDLYKAYHNLLSDTTYMPSNFTIAFRRLLGYAPVWLSDLHTVLPMKDLKRMYHYMKVARSVAKDLVNIQMNAQAGGKEGGKDVMSIFVKANAAEDPNRRLDEDEILSQITTLMLAGHETTANTVGWTLYELSKHPDVQRKLRDEVRAVRAEARARGDQDITIPDLDSMKYMGAVMKETLRYHPILLHIFRTAAQDDVIPLDIPQQTVSGDFVTAIPISEGQIVRLSFAAYNRIESVWGHDADQWRPERFLDDGLPKENQTKVGVYGNLATFSSGLRACIGWRFSLIEMQALLVELLDNFEFSPALGDIEIKRAVTAIMQPMVKGQEGQGSQLPLTVTSAEKCCI